MSIITIVLFFLVLGVLIFIHEFGHFVTAVKSGIKAEEFGFGFPPRLAGLVNDDTTGRWRVVFGDHEIISRKTVYSLNWIPFGGFVRMKGEDANSLTDQDSFAAKSAGTRIFVLAAGVAMNFLLAWVLVSGLYLFGFPQPVTEETRAQTNDISIKILAISQGSPAEVIGMRPGDRLVSVDGIGLSTLNQAQQLIADRKGSDIPMEIRRGNQTLTLHGTPRIDAPAGEGALGISFAEVGTVRYSWYQAPVKGAIATWNATMSIFSALGALLAGLFLGKGGAADVTGPVGIVYVTKQMSELGIAYLIQFAAVLSINLAIFNILPLPALDGGRILFILIEKVKGSPVREVVEHRAHQIGFFLLLLAMIAVTVRDVSKFELLRKIVNLF
ncbi:MAG: RIP metalloprotease RseP [Candidatus Moranbacteria bacterium]|nr:RIP metalloprotease RseP [Candidatus Moranbacteria bacterium]